MPHGRGIDEKVTELLKLPDEELVDLGLKHIKSNLSLTSNKLVERVCNEYKAGDVIPRDYKALVAIFVAFEELTRDR